MNSKNNVSLDIFCLKGADFMQIIHQAPLSALGLGAAFSVIWGVADPVAALAEVRVIEADGYYIMGEGPEENAAVAKERAQYGKWLWEAGGLQQGNRVLPQGHRA